MAGRHMQRKRAAINKITPPDLPDVVLRERLFDRLDQNQHYSITWIAGPAGSGKTTLLASYLGARNIPCLWYRFDERDFDASTFFYYFGQAAKKALPRMRKPLALLTLEHKENAAGFARDYFEDLSGRMGLPFCMVFDSFETIAHADEFVSIFRKALDGISADIHVFVVSRTKPPPAFSGMLANSRLRVVGQKDLGMRYDETALFLELKTGSGVDPGVVRDLYEKTKGWVAGLVLTAGAFQHGVPLKDCVQEGLPGPVGDYFTGEIYQGIGDSLKRFLTQIAFLPAVTTAAARKMTGDSKAGNLLAAIYRENLFVERFSASAYTYQFHPMFRSFLLSKARDTLDSEEIQQAWQRAAGILESQGRVEDALECFARLPDAAEIRRLIQAHAVGLIQQGRLETLGAWLDKIPETMLAESPWLLFWTGMRFRPGEAEKARPWFERAFALFEKNKDVIGLYLSWSRIIDSITLAWDDFTRLDPWIEWFDTATYLKSMPPLPDIQARVAASMSGALIIRRPHHPDLAFWLDTALSLCRGIKDVTTQLKTCIWSATYHMWNGDFARAEMDRDIAGKMIKRNAPSPMIQQFWEWLDVSADIRTMAAPEKALDRILLLLEEADKKGRHLADHLFFPPGMFAALALGALDKAKKLLERFRKNTDDTHRQSLVIYYHFQSLYCLLKGRLKRSTVYAESALKISQETGYVFYEALCLFQMAHLAHLQDRQQQATTFLKRAREISTKTGSEILQYMCLIKEAHLDLVDGNHDKGLDCLGRALALGRRNNYLILAWWWDPELLSRLCAEALCADMEIDYARQFVRLHGLRPGPQFFFLEKWPWPVRIHTFERFIVQLDGKVLEFGRRAPRKPLEMLQTLVALGGVDVPVTRILDELWFDADGDMAHSAFSTALNRLRKLLLDKQAIVTSNGRISLNPEHCWVDCLAFQHALAEGDANWDWEKKEAAMGCYQQAFSFYKGLFLASERPLSWIIAARERFKNRFLAATLKMGQWLEQEQRFDAAMACYRKGLSADDLEEVLYQRLMNLQLRLERPSEAVRTYQRCRDRLADGLHVAPSRETEGLYRKAVLP